MRQLCAVGPSRSLTTMVNPGEVLEGLNTRLPERGRIQQEWAVASATYAPATMFSKLDGLTRFPARLLPGLKAPAPTAPVMGNSAASRAGRDGKSGRTLPRLGAACDSELRAARPG
jgi:hypothetical protein